MVDYYLQLNNLDFSGDGNADPLEYHFELVQNLDSNGEIPATTVESDIPENNQHLAFQGKTKNIPIEWLIYDNGTDKSDGTYSSAGITDSRISNDTIVSATEQKVFLEYYIHNPNSTAQWRLFGGRFTDPDGDGTDEGTPVHIQTLNPRTSSPIFGNGILRLRVGSRV